MVTDNNRVNQKFFSLLASDGTFSFQNPSYVDRTIYCVYDSIHVLKNFRNNWLNQRDDDKSFFYPSFQDFSIIQQATFKDIRDVYHSEKRSMIKKAPKLNMKSLYPTRFERQRVSLALNIFDLTTIAALSTIDDPDTAEFLEVIQVWFTIMNNRSIVNGMKDRNRWAEPITSFNDYQVEFLKKFVMWVEAWSDITKMLHVGGLTKDTFEAAVVCTNGIVQLIFESFISCEIEYFLPGKIQTNDVERRFSRYRQLSGCNYNVSVKQIFESEKKLRLKRLMSTYPHELDLKIPKLKSQSDVSTLHSPDISEFSDLIYTNYIDQFKNYHYSSFVYVCGYGGHREIGNLTCDLCRNLIVKSKGDFSGTDYFDYLQRGGLIVPTENCVTILLHMSALFEAIKTDIEKRKKFQFSHEPKNILVLLTMKAVSENAHFIVDWEDECLCGKKYYDLFLPLMSVYANILLKNYKKKINEFTAIAKMRKSKIRNAKNNKNNVNRKAAIYEKIK